MKPLNRRGKSQVTGNRILLFFDLLGFRDRVLSKPIEDIVASFHDVFFSIWSAMIGREASKSLSIEHLGSFIKTYSGFSARDFKVVRSTFEKRTGFTVLLMSDSVVLYSKPLEPNTDELRQTFSASVRLSRIVMLRLFERMLPARAAIAYGEFHADVENSIFCGRALVEAYEASENQDWIGVVLCSSIEEIAQEYEKTFSVREGLQHPSLARPGWDFVRYKVPFKNGVRPSFVINWGSAFNAGGPVRDDFFKDVLTGIKSVDRKYENTLSFLRWLNRMGGRIVKIGRI